MIRPISIEQTAKGSKIHKIEKMTTCESMLNLEGNLDIQKTKTKNPESWESGYPYKLGFQVPIIY